jgi:hypothetical protein
MQIYRFTFSISVLFLILATAATLKAQKTEIALTGGILNSTYKFEEQTTYPNTASFIFPWEGTYSRTNALVGADLLHSLSTHWQVKTGLHFYLTGYVQETDLMWPSEFTLEGYKPLLPNERLIINHLFLEIPLLLRYRLTEKRLTPYAEAGISTNYYLTTGIKERIEGNTKTSRQRNEAVNPVNVALRFAAGVQYRLSEKHRVFLQPMLRYQLGSIEKTAANPGIGWGVEAGWMLRLAAKDN